MGNGLWGKGGEQLQVAEGNVGWKIVEGLVLEIMRELVIGFRTQILLRISAPLGSLGLELSTDFSVLTDSFTCAGDQGRREFRYRRIANE